MPFLAKVLVAWLANVGALWLADELFDGVEIDGWRPLLIAAAVLGILSTFVKPVLVLLSIPLLIVTLGLFLLVINIIVLWLTDTLVAGFDIVGFWTYVGTVLIVWLVNTIVDRVVARGVGV